jgi:hypothetical protein
VIDLGGAAGTVLNQARVEKNAVLNDGDQLTFGEYRIEVGLAPFEPAMQQAGVDAEMHAGPSVAEVVAVYNRTVLDVQHVGQTKNRRSSAPALLAFGGLLMLAGAGAFANDAIQDWDAHAAARTEAAASGRPAPAEPGTGFGGLGVVLAFLGLVPFGLGVVRLGDRGLSRYTIGEAEGAAFTAPTRGLPNADDFALVEGGEHGDATLRFAPGMTGDVTLGDHSLTLAELVASGRAANDGRTFSFPLPEGARCKVEHEGLVFHVNSVPRAKHFASRSEADKPFWLFTAASLVGLGGLLTLAHLAMPDGESMGLDDRLAENRFVGYISQPDDAPEPEPIPDDTDEDQAEAGGQGRRHTGDEGRAGNPAVTKARGLYSMKGPKDAIPQIARDFDPSLAAREAGILGQMKQDSGHFLASPFGQAFAQGNEDEDVWGSLHGEEVGEAFGVGGLGLVGTGRGGGGTGAGTIGLGAVGLIGKGSGGGPGAGVGSGGDRYGNGGNGLAFNRKKKKIPRINIAKPIGGNGMDKDIIRRVVRAHINEIRHCYNQGLVRDPNMQGRVAIQFSIGPTGAVPKAFVSQQSIGDRSVASCMATAVKRWRFPRPPGGGHVIVTYPFVVNPG